MLNELTQLSWKVLTNALISVVFCVIYVRMDSCHLHLSLLTEAINTSLNGHSAYCVYLSNHMKTRRITRAVCACLDRKILHVIQPTDVLYGDCVGR